MSEFNIKRCEIEGVLIIEPKSTEGGNPLTEDLPTAEQLEALGIEDVEFTEQYGVEMSRSELVGLHFMPGELQAKLVSVAEGSINCVVVDMREESVSFGGAYSLNMSAENGRMIYIPARFAHGMLSLERDTIAVCKYSSPYEPKQEGGIIWDDQTLMIDWEFERYDIDPKWLKLSQQDKRQPHFRSYNPRNLWDMQIKGARARRRDPRPATPSKFIK